jgi:hypothetical protein
LQQNIAGLDVPVQDAALVRVMDSPRHRRH